MIWPSRIIPPPAAGQPAWRRNLCPVGVGAAHLIMASTGLRLRGAAEWEIEKHGTTRRRSWSKLHIGLDPDTGEIVCFDLTARDVDDAGHVVSLLGQVSEAIISFMGDGACVGDPVRWVVERHGPGARFVAPPR